MNAAELITDCERLLKELRANSIPAPGQAINLESLKPDPLAELNAMMYSWRDGGHTFYRWSAPQDPTAWEPLPYFELWPRPRVLDKKLSSRVKEVTDTHAVIEETWSTK